MNGSRGRIVVVGGGPVGLVAALEARRAGFPVTVVEPRRPPIDKACGEGIMPAGLAQLRALGVVPLGVELTGITYADGPLRATAAFRSGSGLGARRTDLHEALVAAVRDAGAAWCADAVSAADPHDSGVRLTLRSGDRMEAGWVLAADGLHSRLRRLVSPHVLRPPRMRRYGFVTHVPDPSPRSTVTVHWSPLGEAYLTPLPGGRTGVAVLTRLGIAPAQVVRAVPDVAALLAGHDAGFSRGAGPFCQVPVRRTRGRIFLVGDAAGYVDALTGEGLSLGFAQAHEAVRAIGRNDPAAYERAWWRISAGPLGLAGALVGTTRMPLLRNHIVTLAARSPRLFEGIVAAAAGGAHPHG